MIKASKGHQLAWHILPEDGKLARLKPSDHKRCKPLKVGQTTKRTAKPVELCGYGLHSSERLTEAMYYCQNFEGDPWVCLVEIPIKGTKNGYDKHVSPTRKILAMFRATRCLQFLGYDYVPDIYHSPLQQLKAVHCWTLPEAIIEEKLK